ncbi:MAG: hypothetical protein ACRDP7_11025, partial [Trebonia sp.]
LRPNAIGLREVLFQSITGMAPGAAVAASIPAGAGYAGGSLPLAVVFALIACLLSASSIGLLAREMPAAGSLATYAARGIHPAAGFLTAWGYVLVSILIPPRGRSSSGSPSRGPSTASGQATRPPCGGRGRSWAR